MNPLEFLEGIAFPREASLEFVRTVHALAGRFGRATARPPREKDDEMVCVELSCIGAKVPFPFVHPVWKE